MVRSFHVVRVLLKRARKGDRVSTLVVSYAARGHRRIGIGRCHRLIELGNHPVHTRPALTDAFPPYGRAPMHGLGPKLNARRHQLLAKAPGQQGSQHIALISAVWATDTTRSAHPPVGYPDRRPSPDLAQHVEVALVTLTASTKLLRGWPHAAHSSVWGMRSPCSRT